MAEASRQRIAILEQLTGVYRDLKAVPALLESAYQEEKDPPRTGGVAPVNQTNGVSRG